jgi:hypothetical protein
MKRQRARQFVSGKLSMKAVVSLEKIRFRAGFHQSRRGDLENSFLAETKQTELDVKSELQSRASESFDFVERQMSPEADGSKTAAVVSLQLNKPSSAQTVKLPPKSLIQKWGLRELAVRLQRIDVPKMVRYK